MHFFFYTWQFFLSPLHYLLAVISTIETYRLWQGKCKDILRQRSSKEEKNSICEQFLLAASCPWFFFSYRNCNMMILCNCLHILESLWAVALWYHTAGAKNSFCFFPKATTKLLTISLQNNQHFVGRSLYYFVIVLVGKKKYFSGEFAAFFGWKLSWIHL